MPLVGDTMLCFIHLLPLFDVAKSMMVAGRREKHPLIVGQTDVLIDVMESGRHHQNKVSVTNRS